MHLSLLSEGYVSDSFNDAGMTADVKRRRATTSHFPALCRGLAVLIALALPIGLTLIAKGPCFATSPQIEAGPDAAVMPRAKSQG